MCINLEPKREVRGGNRDAVPLSSCQRAQCRSEAEKVREHRGLGRDLRLDWVGDFGSFDLRSFRERWGSEGGGSSHSVPARETVPGRWMLGSHAWTNGKMMGR